MRFCIWIWVWICRWFPSICTCPVRILIWFMVHYYVVIAVTGVLISPVWQRLTHWYCGQFLFLNVKLFIFVPNDRLWSIRAPALFSSCDAQTMWNYSVVMRKNSSYKTEHLLSVYQCEFYICGGFFAKGISTWGSWQSEPGP